MPIWGPMSLALVDGPPPTGLDHPLGYAFAGLLARIGGSVGRGAARLGETTRGAEDLAPPTGSVPARPAVEARLDLAERLWGCSGLAPHHGLRHLLAGTRLSEGARILHLTAASGVEARAFARLSHLRVWAMDPDADIAAEGFRRAVAEGGAGVEHFHPRLVRPPRQAFEMVATGPLGFTLRGRRRLLRRLADTLAPGGRLVWADYALSDAAGFPAALMEWIDGEPGGARPWTIRHGVERLEGAGLRMLRVADCSRAHADAVRAGWARLSAGKQKAIAGLDRDLVLEQCGLWRRRLAALDSGVLRLVVMVAERPERRANRG